MKKVIDFNSEKLKREIAKHSKNTQKNISEEQVKRMIEHMTEQIYNKIKDVQRNKMTADFESFVKISI